MIALGLLIAVGLTVAAHAAQKVFGTIEKVGIRQPRVWA